MAGYLAAFYPGTAKKVLREIKERIAGLADFPELYEMYDQDSFYRRIPVCQHLVFYHINEEKQTIDIHRVLRASWDLPAYL